MKNKLEKILKGWFKRKVSLTTPLLVLFMITGQVSLSDVSENDFNDLKNKVESPNLALGEGASVSVNGGVALGKDASVNHRDGSAGKGGIAIGEGAQSHQMTGANHEAVIKFGRELNQMTGGIAIGTKTHARIGTIDIGNRDYKGDIGDLTEINENQWDADTWNRTAAVGATTVGNNSINSGNFANITGAYNVISKAKANKYRSYEELPDKIKEGVESIRSIAGMAGYNVENFKQPLLEGANVLRNAGAAVQGLGATINGTFNSIEAAEDLDADLSALKMSGGPDGFVGMFAKPVVQGAFGMSGKGNPAKGLMFSGFSSTVLGVANRTAKSNGTVIIGSANEVDNAYITPKSRLVFDSKTTNLPMNFTLSLDSNFKNANGSLNSIKELADTFRKYGQDNELGSVGVMGGANKVNYAVFSNINGVGNKLSGKAEAEYEKKYKEMYKAEVEDVLTTITALDKTAEKNKLEKKLKDKLSKEFYSKPWEEQLSNFSAFNNVQGYKNTGTNISHTNVQGSENKIENASKNIVMGSHHNLSGTIANATNTEEKLAEGNIILGFNTKDTAESGSIKESAKNILVLGNDVKANTDNSVYLGAGSTEANSILPVNPTNRVAATTPARSIGNGEYSEGMDGYNEKFAGKVSDGIISVGSDGHERRIQNIAAGLISENSTDAINGSQLFALKEKIEMKADKKDVEELAKKIDLHRKGQLETLKTIGKDLGELEVVNKKMSKDIEANKESIEELNNFAVSTIKEIGDLKTDKADKTDIIAITEVVDTNKKEVETLKSKVGTGKIEEGNINTVTGGLVFEALKEKGSNIEKVKTEINNFKQEVKDNINTLRGELKGDINTLGATSSAMAGIEFLDIGVNQATVGAALGTYGGRQAVAVGVQTAPTNNTRIHAKVSVAPDKTHSKAMGSIGASWRFNLK